MTDANKSAAASSASSPVDIHGPDCDHDHDHVGQVHGPDCNDDHHGHHKAPIRQVMRAGPKIGRNDTCPCGSGKKYKKCCMPA